MRLLICSSNYPYPDEPNKGVFMRRTMKALAKRAEIDVVVPVPYFPSAVPSERYRRYARIPKQAALDGLTIRYPRVLVTPKVGRSLYGLSYAAGLYGTMASLVRERRPQALLAFWAYPDGFATVLLSRVFRLPVFVCGLGCDVNDIDHHFGKRSMVGWTFRHSTGSLAVSRALGKAIEALGVEPAKVAVVPNGLDEGFLARTGDLSPFDSGPEDLKTVQFCGRLSPEKNPLYLLEAARILFSTRSDVQVRFVGDGPLRPRMEALAAEWGIENRVTFTGEVHHEQIARYMQQASVLCLTSLREGYPNVLLEGLACGVPIVATDVGGVREIVSDPSLGMVVPLGQPETLARALDASLSRQWDRNALRESVRGRSWDDVAGEMLDFIGRAAR